MNVVLKNAYFDLPSDAMTTASRCVTPRLQINCRFAAFDTGLPDGICIFIPKIPNWEYFGRALAWKIFCLYMQFFATWSILRPFGICCGFWYILCTFGIDIFHFLVCCTEKNLATLI
jgi:hypothetical protein